MGYMHLALFCAMHLHVGHGLTQSFPYLLYGMSGYRRIDLNQSQIINFQAAMIVAYVCFLNLFHKIL